VKQMKNKHFLCCFSWQTWPIMFLFWYLVSNDWFHNTDAPLKVQTCFFYATSYARMDTALHLMLSIKLQYFLYNLLANEELVNQLDWPSISFCT
jgi:hypothetical protein